MIPRTENAFPISVESIYFDTGGGDGVEQHPEPVGYVENPDFVVESNN